MTHLLSRAAFGAVLSFALLAGPSGAGAQTRVQTVPVAPAKPAPAAATPAPAAQAPLPKTYSRADLVEAARKLEAQLRREQKPLPKPAAQLRKDAEAALAKGDQRSAADLYARLAQAAGTDAGLWLRLARSVAAIKPEQGEDGYAFLNRASGAAYLAYRRATTRAEEADALYFIARLYAERYIWRAALDTQLLALSYKDTPAERAWYDKLRAERGFRIDDYSVDSDAASPRVCVQFSEQLAPGRVDYSSYVTLAGPSGPVDKPAVAAENSQLCVEGLRHGERYDIELRAGIPSVIPAETLLRASQISIYVRDRSPTVRFTGRNYVLPRTGPRNIPLVSINTSLVGVELMRIGDRSLLPTALEGDFLKNLYGYDRRKLKDGQAELIYSGQLETANRLNEEVTTAFPVDEAIGQLLPGVYVLTAAPAGEAADPDAEYRERAAQWFVVSDLGLTALSGADGLTAVVRSLGSARPAGDVELRLVAASNEVLATAKTDATGTARFDAGLMKGKEGLAPAVLVARGAEGDYAFLSLKDQAFDLTDRGVGGRAAPTGLDVFLTPERGVYRTGESVHVTALVRDPQARAVAGLPLTLVLKRPDGVEDRRLVVQDAGQGGRAADLPVMAGAMGGTWRIEAYADPKAAPVGEATFLVEDYVPERLDMTLSTTATALSPSAPADIAVEGRWLFGPPAVDLEVEGEIAVTAADQRPGLPGWRFGRPDDGFEAVRAPLPDSPRTDAAGKASLKVALPQLAATQRPLKATVMVRLAEGGGRAIERDLTLPVAAAGEGLGLRPLFKADDLARGGEAAFELAAFDAAGQRVAKSGVTWELFRIERTYQWYRLDGSWDFEPVKTTRKVADGTIDLTADAPGKLALPVEWGNYQLEVSSGGLSTAVPFSAGWGGDATAETPDRLEVGLDREQYAPGETLTVSLTSRHPGSATVLIVGDGVLASKTLDVAAGDTAVPFTVDPKWGPGAYALAFLYRPLDVAAGRNPGRSIGLAWFGVDQAARVLGVELEAPDQVRPETTLAVPVSLAGLGQGEEAYLTLALVDVGILNLTGFESPDPDAYYLGQRTLSAQVRDLYGQLIDGMLGTRGRLRSGGDAGDGGLKAEPPNQPPLALFSGVVKAGPDGKANVTFDVPAFDGTGRLMAVAWSKDRIGHAAKDVVIRDPVVVTATLPRFLASADTSTLRLDLTNVEGEAGDYALDIVTDGPIEVGGAPQSVTLGKGGRQGLALALKGTGIGPAKVSVRIGGPGGLAIARDYVLRVRPAYPEITRRTVRLLQPGESVALSADLMLDLVPGTGTVAVSAGPDANLDVAGLVSSLDRYPYTCSEQLTSRALPMLYLSELAKDGAFKLQNDPAERIRESIRKVSARQGSNGSFGLWSAGGDDLWLDAYVTDFLTRAKERGHEVPELVLSQALDRLRNGVSLGAGSDGPTGDGAAYAVYVLARNGRAPLGDLRYVADAKLDEVKGPFARGQIAAALAMLGDRGRAEKVFNAALEGLPTQAERERFGRADFGSVLRDAAGVATLAAEAGFPGAARTARERIGASPEVGRTSTQEDAWLLMAARAARTGTGIRLDIDGAAHEGIFERSFDRTGLTGHRTVLTNRGEAPVDVVVSIIGSPAAPEPPSARGFKLKRSYFTLDGKPADIAKVQQNQRLVVVLEAEEEEAAPSHILLVDWLPAGLEIDNPRLAVGGDTGSLAWIGETTEADHTEFRDDRFTAAFDLTQDAEEPGIFRVAYIVRAVSPGSYAHPPATVEDMYRPDRFARTAAGMLEVTGGGK